LIILYAFSARKLPQNTNFIFRLACYTPAKEISYKHFLCVWFLLNRLGC